MLGILDLGEGVRRLEFRVDRFQGLRVMPSPPFSEPHSCTGIVMPASDSAVKKIESGSATTAALIRRSCHKARWDTLAPGFDRRSCRSVLRTASGRARSRDWRRWRRVPYSLPARTHRCQSDRDRSSLPKAKRRSCGRSRVSPAWGAARRWTNRKTGSCRAPYRRDGSGPPQQIPRRPGARPCREARRTTRPAHARGR